jgi:hypothetical protein
VYTQKTVYDKVVWPASSTINQTALQAMKPEEALKIADSGVPVLVFNDIKLLAAGILVEPSQNGYDFSMPDSVDGIQMVISGGRVGAQTTGLPPETASETDLSDRTPLRGKYGVKISQSEEGLRATWVENGEADYELRMYCDAAADVRCSTNDYIADVIKKLVYVGGNGQ